MLKFFLVAVALSALIGPGCQAYQLLPPHQIHHPVLHNHQLRREEQGGPVGVGGHVRERIQNRLEVNDSARFPVAAAAATTTTTTTTTTSRPTSIFVNNNVSPVAAGCMLHFECKKRLKVADSPKPCVKYCVKYLECPDEPKKAGKSNECVELLEDHATQTYQEQQRERELEAQNSLKEGGKQIMQVAMIDFPCQPGYLPDSRGRCREVW